MAAQPAHPSRLGDYRQPAIWSDTIVFAAEGDLWRVGVAGGVAQRLTTHPEEESRPAKASAGQIGYVHLRAMGAGNMAEWMREFYPVFDRADQDQAHSGAAPAAVPDQALIVTTAPSPAAP